MPSVFSDGMVLQRNIPVPVWGWGENGEQVTVSFSGQTKTTKVEDEQWMVYLEPLAASAASAEMLVKAGDKEITIGDVLVGEVWVCGGQSNMDWILNSVSSDTKDPKHQPIADYNKQKVNNANDPLLRQIKVPRATSVNEELHDFDAAWVKATPDDIGNFTATGYYFARELRQYLDVPVGLLNCNWGGTRVEPWIPVAAYKKNPKLAAYYDKEMAAMEKALKPWNDGTAMAEYEKKLAAWKVESEKLKAAGEKPPRKPRAPREPKNNQQFPSTLFNAMLHPLIPYAVKGAIWYQGESNAGYFPQEYEERFSTLIQSWREQWGQDKFYFYWCQLAAFKQPNEQPIEKDGWTTVTDNQRRTLKLEDTGMAVLNDIGEAEDIHPRNKIDAGKRLSRWALQQAYGKDLVASGPLYKSSEVKGDKVIISFDHAGSGLMVGKKHLLDPVVQVDEPLQRFQIRGEDTPWKWAQAEISGPDQVTVWHQEIPNPTAVRYAWSQNPAGANLYNKEGLPASIFKTD